MDSDRWRWVAMGGRGWRPGSRRPGAPAASASPLPTQVRTNLQKQAIALAQQPMSSGQIARLALSPAAYWDTARGIVAARGLGALYLGLGFKIAHIGGTGALNAALIPQFKRILGTEREVI